MSACGVRSVVCFATWFSLMVFYVLRSNISVAVLAMTKEISIPGDTPNSTGKVLAPQFAWDDKLIGQILGAFFYGYASTHFLGSIISAKVGPRILLTICLLGASIATLMTPYLSHKSPYALIAARVLVGIFSGSLYPIIQEILGVWAPQSERTVLASLTHSGNIFGIVLTYTMGSYFCGPRFGRKGWEYFFYFSGGISAFAALLWLLFGFDSPTKHPCISKQEVDYIRGTPIAAAITDDSHGVGKTPSLKSIPFKKIFTSLPVWAAASAHAGYLFIFYAMVTGQAKFLSDVYKLSIPQASLYSAIPFVSNFLIQLMIPPIIDYLRTKRGMNISTLRRGVSGIGFTCGCAIIMSVGFFNENQFTYVLIVMTIALGVIGLNNSGYLTASIDIAPAYAGIVMGLMNTFGSIAGFLNAGMAGLLVGKYKDNKLLGWRYTFIITGVVAYYFGLMFIIFGSSEPQSWSKGKKYMPLKQHEDEPFSPITNTNDGNHIKISKV